MDLVTPTDAGAPPEAAPAHGAPGRAVRLGSLLCFSILAGGALALGRAPLLGLRLCTLAVLSALLAAAIAARRPRLLRALPAGALALGLLMALLAAGSCGAAVEEALLANQTPAAALRVGLAGLPTILFCLGAGTCCAFTLAQWRPEAPAAPAQALPPPPPLLEAAAPARAADLARDLSDSLSRAQAAAQASDARAADLARDLADVLSRAHAAAQEAHAAAQAIDARVAAQASDARAAEPSGAAGEDAVRAVAALEVAVAAVREAAQAEILALRDASTQAVRLFTGVSRHLDQTWDKVQGSLPALQSGVEELRKVRGQLDAMAVKLISAESKGRENADTLDALGQEMEDLRAQVREQQQSFERTLTLQRAEQSNLSMSLDRIRRLLEQTPGSSRR